MIRRVPKLAWLAGALGLCLVVSLGLGAVAIPPARVAAILAAKAGLPFPLPVPEGEAVVLGSIRLPRLLCAALAGSGLALAGAALQGLFRNPLADPGLLGISGGAALGASAFLVFGARLACAASPLLLPAAAFAGALLATAAVERLGRRGGQTSTPTLLLAGIALNALCTAGVGLLFFAANDAQLRSLTFWTLGSFGGATWASAAVLAPLVVAPGLLLLRRRRVLDALLLGEAEAGHLGFAVEREKRAVFLCAATMVGATVALAGMISFVGLIVPHLVRLWIGPDHRRLLPGAALLGALLLSGADTASRIAVAPAELPIGIVTALGGVPFFLWLLRREEPRG